MKKFVSKLVAGVMLATTIFSVSAFAEDKTITVIHTNDTHAAAKDDGKAQIGFAKVGAYVQSLKKSNPNVLVLDAGDMFQGLPFANLEKGHSMVDIVNKVGYDAMTVGNHEFDFGAKNLFEIEKKLNYPMLAANITKDGKEVFKPYIIKEMAGAKVGIFGLATPETAYKTHPDNVKGYVFGDIVKSAQATVDTLKNKEKADVIIMIGHLGLYEGQDTSDSVAKNVKGIDLIVDGHSHTTTDAGVKEGDTLIVSTGSSLKNIGKVELTLENNKVKEAKSSLLKYADFANVTPDATIAELIKKVDDAQKPILDKVVGKTKVDLVGERTIVRTGESNLGQLATDAMLDLTDADIALTNGGGIRTSIPAGDITMGQLVAVFPFGNTLMVKDVKGSDILAALEHGVKEYPNELGGFPHTAGMTFTLNAKAPVGSRISDAKVNGQPLVKDKMYTLVTNDFMAVGGDGYDMLKSYPIKAEYNTLMDTLLDYVAAQGTVEGKFSPRMTINEKEVTLPNEDIMTMDNVGLRQFAEGKGYKVEFDNKAKKVEMTKGDVQIILDIKARTFTGTSVGGVASYPVLENGHYFMASSDLNRMLAA